MNIIKKLVCKNLSLNRKRTVVTIIGIILSVALLSAVSSMVASFQKSLVSYQKEKAGDFHVAYYGATSENLEEFDNNRAIESYFTISDLGYARMEESKNEYKPYCRIVSADEEGLHGARLHLLEGRFPENGEEIVIPRHLKTNGRVEYQVGDTLTLQVGDRIRTEDGKKLAANVRYLGEKTEELTDIREKTYRIVGIIERPCFGMEAYECPGYTFVTYGEQREANLSVYTRFNRQGMKNTNAVIAGVLGVDYELFSKVNGGSGEVTPEELDEYSRQMDQAKYDVFLNSWLISCERIWPLDSSMLAIFIIAVFVTLIIICTSVYCIKNSFDISITEKIRQYGMLSSVGATKKQIRKSVHMEAAIMGWFGIPLGILSGLFAAYVLIRISNLLLMNSLNLKLVFAPSLWAVLVAVVLGIVTIYFSAVGSARKAGKVSPMEAIRNQTEIKLTAKSVKTPGYIRKLFGIGGVISYKNIKRNRRKYRTTVVSIVICTITFIVISYFMSMAMDLVSASYIQDGYNVCFNLYLSPEYEFDLSQIENLENVEEATIARTKYMLLEDYEYSEAYREAFQPYEGEEVPILILALDDESFTRYAKECGVSHSEGKVIFINSCFLTWEEGDRSKSGELAKFRYQSGETVKCYYLDDSQARWDENDELIEESIQKREYQIPIDAVTGLRPMGYKSNTGNNYLVMSFETVEKLGIALSNNYDFFFLSSDADILQDDLEVIIQNCEDENAGYSIYNRDKDEREEKSLFLLLDIFAYGLIIVIALIGITNIINTLGTSVELRSREFATLRSVGMTDKQFRKMVVLESIFTSGKSLFIGVTVGMLLSYGINRLECSYDMVIPFRPPVLSAIIAVAVVMILIYAIIRSSMMRINRRNIIETIKNENR